MLFPHCTNEYLETYYHYLQKDAKLDLITGNRINIEEIGFKRYRLVGRTRRIKSAESKLYAKLQIKSTKNIQSIKRQ